MIACVSAGTSAAPEGLVARVRVSPITCSGRTTAPKIRDATSATVRFWSVVDPPEAMVARYAGLLREHSWNLKPVMRALFLDPEFYSESFQFSRILGPIEFAVAIARKLPGDKKPPAFLIALAVFWLVEVIVASVNASNGVAHRYPLTIHFVS